MKVVIRPRVIKVAFRQGPRGLPGVTTWDGLGGKPELFPPSAHTHTFSSLEGIPDTLEGYGILDAATAAELEDEFNRATSVEDQLRADLDGHGHNSDDIAEGSENLYFTPTRVANWLLTGVAFVTATTITAADNLLTALGKLQAQISAEISSRGQADSNLQSAITAEASTRSTNDTNLSTAIGLKANTASPTFTGSVTTPQLLVTVTPIASASAIIANGSLFTGGTGTTTLPYHRFQPTGTTPATTWNTSGTWLGINAASGFSGSFLDFRINGGTSLFSVFASGSISAAGNLTLGGNLSVTGTATFTGIPTGPTATVGTNTTQFSTTAFVQAAISNLIANAVTWLGKITAPAVVVDSMELTASNIVSVTGSRALASTDNGKTLVCTGGANIALTVPSTLPAGFRCNVISSLNAKFVVTLVTSSTSINGMTRTQPLPAETSTDLIWRSSNAYGTIIRELSSKFPGSHARRVLLSDDFFHAANWFQMVSGTAHMSPGDYLGAKTGAVTMWTGATNNSVAALGCGINGNCWLQAIQPWRCEFIFSIPDITNCRVRVGFSNCSNTYNPDIFGGSIFCGLDYNPTLHANFRYANGEGGTYVYTDSAVVAATGWIKLEMRSGGADQSIYYSINGGPETLLTGQYDFIAGPVFAIRNTSGVDRIMYAEYFGMEGYINR